jgi:hypothetical protein
MIGTDLRVYGQLDCGIIHHMLIGMLIMILRKRKKHFETIHIEVIYIQ